MSEYVREHTNPPVFFVSGAVVLAFVVVGVAMPERFSRAALGLRDAIGEYFGWFYVLATAFFLGVALWLMVSRHGGVRLGPDNSKPEFSTPAWFAMLFSAGMGIGLVFYGVYEPLSHTADPFIGASGDTAATVAQYTFFHWGLHAWAIYIIPGIALGYFCFRKGLPMRPASALYPLLGDRIYGWAGDLIDVLAVFATLFGLATSLGLGTAQINSGLSSAFGIPDNTLVQIAAICIVTAIAVVSVVSGVDKGIRRLAVLNMWTSGLLLLVIVLLGPKLFMMSMVVSGLGDYFQNLVQMSLTYVSPEGDADAREFSETWSFFYWGWWISWSPFVGMFMARISYGRTIRQFVGASLFGMLGITAAWFGAFGGSGIYHDMRSGGALSGDGAPAGDGGGAVFALLESFDLPHAAFAALVVFTIAVGAVFYITSADSASLVVDMLTNGGDPHPVRLQRVFWSALIGVITIVLLIIGGETAVEALQAASVSTGLPFGVVLVLIAVSLIRALRREAPPAGARSRTGRSPFGPGAGAGDTELDQGPATDRMRMLRTDGGGETPHPRRPPE